MLLTFLCLFVLIQSGSLTGMKDATGVDFTDRFDRFDDSQWIRDEDHLHCLGIPSGPTIGQCSSRREVNVEINHHVQENGKQTHSEMSITMRNDCIGHECCIDGKCTPYTTGTVTSRRTYAYGSFRFFVRISDLSHSRKSGAHNGLACVSLENSGPTSVHGMQSISFCVIANDPSKARIMWKISDEIKLRKISLPMDVSKTAAFLRIDWAPKFIRWYVNGKEVASVTSVDNEIPDKPLNIKMFVIPKMDKPVLLDTDEVELQMNIFRCMYRKFDLTSDNHTELLVHKRDGSKIPKIIFILCIISLIAFLYHLAITHGFGSRCTTKTTATGYYLLLDYETSPTAEGSYSL